MLKRAVLLVSVVLHAVALTTILVAQLLAVGPLPIPHQPTMFADVVGFVRVHDVPRPAHGSPTGRTGASSALAPIAEPSTITPETGRESAAMTSVGTDPTAGIAPGISDAWQGAAIQELVPPPPPPVREQPIHLRAGMTPPRKIVNVDPRYPSMAQVTRVEGVVIVEAIIDTSGSVTSVRVLRSIPLLDQAATDAVRLWRFSPAQLNGRAVPVFLTVTVSFRLER